MPTNDEFTAMLTVNQRVKAIEILLRLFPSDAIHFWIDSEGRGNQVNLQIKAEKISASLQLSDQLVRFILEQAKSVLESDKDLISQALAFIDGE